MYVLRNRSHSRYQDFISSVYERLTGLSIRRELMYSGQGFEEIF